MNAYPITVETRVQAAILVITYESEPVCYVTCHTARTNPPIVLDRKTKRASSPADSRRHPSINSEVRIGASITVHSRDSKNRDFSRSQVTCENYVSVVSNCYSLASGECFWI